MSRADDVSLVPQAVLDGAAALDGAPRGTGSPAAPTVARSSPLVAWSLTLAAALLAALAAFGIGETLLSHTGPNMNLPPEIRKSQAKRSIELKRRQKIWLDRTAAMAYGGLGMILGLGLGVAGGLVRRSTTAAVGAGFVGLVLGGAAGAGGAMAVLPYYHSALAALPDAERENNLSAALLTHGGMWVGIGAAAGLALGLGLGGLGRLARAAAGGILGAALAAAVYEFAGAMLFPAAETFRPMAAAAVPRLLADLCVAIGVAVAALGIADYVTLGRTRTAAGPSG